jgi:hypothetical protein
LSRQKSDIRSPDLAERPSSIHELEALIDRALPEETKKLTIKDYAQEAISLRREFFELAKCIDLPFYITMLECESDVFILVISEFKLDGGELEDHSWVQRTYAYQAENKHASWATFTQVGEYPYIVETPTRLKYLGITREKKKIAPIVWVAASDGQCRVQEETMRLADDRNLPSYMDTMQAQLAYGVNVTARMAESHKILAQNAAEEKQSSEDIRKEEAYKGKEVAKKGLENMALINKAQKDSPWSSINIFSKASIRYLFYILGLFALVYIINLLLHVYWGWPMVFPGGETGIGGGQPPGTGTPVTEMP